MHNEPHIMFSTDKKELLCINCFREYSAESKLHCVDLDTAYADSVRRLERTVVVSGPDRPTGGRAVSAEGEWVAMG